MYKGFIKAELQRYAVTNTLPADFERMKTLFMTRLLDRGYQHTSCNAGLMLLIIHAALRC
jgi:hypothetical protein